MTFHNKIILFTYQHLNYSKSNKTYYNMKSLSTTKKYFSNTFFNLT